MVLIVNDDALITKAELAKQFKEKMKEQERQAIKALIAAKEQLILAKGAELATQLQAAALDMKNYASMLKILRVDLNGRQRKLLKLI